jgi:hypothetical protein
VVYLPGKRDPSWEQCSRAPYTFQALPAIEIPLLRKVLLILDSLVRPLLDSGATPLSSKKRNILKKSKTI